MKEITHVNIPVPVIEAALTLMRHASFPRHTFDEAAGIIAQLETTARQSMAIQQHQAETQATASAAAGATGTPS